MMNVLIGMAVGGIVSVGCVIVYLVYKFKDMM